MKTMKKYELLKDDKITVGGRKLYRIRALKDFGTVRRGDLGGYIEKEANLSHFGNAWVFDSALVFGNAWVRGDACIFDDARVSGSARVLGQAVIRDNAWVRGDAWICDNAEVCDTAGVEDNANIQGNARVYGNARVFNYASVYGGAHIFGNARVGADMCIYSTAEIRSNDDFQIFYNVGSELGTLVVFRTTTGPIVTRGCFSGTLDEFKDAVENRHGDSKIGKHYKLIIQAIELWFNYKEQK